MKTFKHAFNGIWQVIKRERNSKIHILATVLVIVAGFYFKIEASEWLAVTITIMLVFAMEMINTALEYLCDHVSPEFHKSIKVIKDISAGAVLVTAFGAIVVACIIFIPHIINLFQ